MLSNDVIPTPSNLIGMPIGGPSFPSEGVQTLFFDIAPGHVPTIWSGDEITLPMSARVHSLLSMLVSALSQRHRDGRVSSLTRCGYLGGRSRSL